MKTLFQFVEAKYHGNIGAMEIFKFFQMASAKEKALFHKYAAVNDKERAWDLVTKVTGMELQRSKTA